MAAPTLLKRGVSGLAAACLLLSSNLGCVDQDVLVRGITDKIVHQARVHDACELHHAPDRGGANEVGAFIGDDADFVDRALVGIFGRALKCASGEQCFSPDRQIGARLTALLEKLEPKAQTGHKKAIYEALTKLRTDLSAAYLQGDEAASALSGFLGELQRKRVLAELNRCAGDKLRGKAGAVGPSCSLGTLLRQLEPSNAVVKYVEVLGSPSSDDRQTRLVTVLAADLREFVGRVEEAGKEALFDRDIDRPDLMFLAAELAAFGGVLRDRERALHRLRDSFSSSAPPKERAIAFARMVVESQSEQIVDLLLFWVGKAIARVERLLARLDEHTLGMATTATELSLNVRAVQRGMCELSAQVRHMLLEAGLNEHAFAARVCYAATAGRKNYPQSEIMSALLAAMIESTSRRGCDGSKEDALPESPTARDVARRPRGAEFGGLFQRLRDSADDVARANWDTRLVEAQHRLAKLATIDLSEAVFPVLSELDPMTRAAFLDAELQVGSSLSVHGDRDSLGRFLELTNQASPILLAFSRDLRSPDAANPAELVNASATATVGAEGMKKEVAQVAHELCEQRARLDVRAQAERLCQALRSTRRGEELHCDPTGFGVDLRVDKLKVKPLHFLPDHGTSTLSAKRSLEALAYRLAEMAGTGQLDSFTRISVVGSASQEEVKEKSQESMGAAVCAVTSSGCATERGSDLLLKHATELLDEMLKTESFLISDPQMSSRMPLRAWLDSWTNKVKEKEKAETEAQTKEDKAAAKAGRNELYNRLLALLRGLGTLKAMHDRFDKLCDAGRSCEIVPHTAVDLADGDDAGWRGFSVALEPKSDKPSCSTP